MVGVAITLDAPDVDDLGGVVAALREWQHDASPMQLHPGDLGWAWQAGAAKLAASIRTWRRAGTLVGIGFLDSPDVFRVTVAPDTYRDEDLASRLVADLAAPDRGVLPSGKVSVESPNDTRVQELLDGAGWELDMPWTPLRRDLTDPVEESAVRTEVIGVDRATGAAEYVTIHRSSFESTRLTAELLQTMAAGVPHADARSLLARDAEGHAVGVVTVWSAGPGRPGLLEPMGVHADHQGHGFGRAICLAAAAALREMGASSAVVCTPSSRVPAVATYRSAGFEQRPERLDRSRPV